MTLSLASQCTVAATYLDGVDLTLLAKPQRVMPGTGLEQRKVFIRELLNVRGQLAVALPE